jgi:hypothetical protein
MKQLHVEKEITTIDVRSIYWQSQLEALVSKIAIEQNLLPQYDKLANTVKAIVNKTRQLEEFEDKRRSISSDIMFKIKHQTSWQKTLIELADVAANQLKLEYENERSFSRKAKVSELITLNLELSAVNTAFEISIDDEFLKVHESADSTSNQDATTIRRKAREIREEVSKYALELFGSVPEDLSGMLDREANKIDYDLSEIKKQIKTELTRECHKGELERGLLVLEETILNLYAELATINQAIATIEIEINELISSKEKLLSALTFTSNTAI